MNLVRVNLILGVWMATFRLNKMIEAFIGVNFPEILSYYNDDGQILSELPENIRIALPPGK